MSKTWQHGKKGASNDLPSCRGKSIVVGTCDAARERETSKEMVNILLQSIEIYKAQRNAEKNEGCDSSGQAEEDSSNSWSIADMLRQELAEVKAQKHSTTQDVMSVNTGIRGVVVIKINNPAYCPVELVKLIFERVRKERSPCSRNVVRLFPLKYVCFPKEDELEASLRLAVEDTFQYKRPGEHVISASAVDTTVRDNDISIEAKGEVGTKRKLEGHESAGESEEKKIAAVTESSEENTEASTDASVTVEAKEPADIVVAVAQDTELQITEKKETSALASTKPIETAGDRSEVGNSSNSENDSSADSAVVAVKKVTFLSTFKARNHNVLNKHKVLQLVQRAMPPYARGVYKDPESTVIVEAIKNICGISILMGLNDKSSGFNGEFNLRKFQQAHSSSDPVAED